MISNARISMIVLSTLALSLALTRCSPLSVSQSRQQTVRGNNGAGSANDRYSATPIGESEFQIQPITSTPATVRDDSDATFRAEIAALPSHQHLTIHAEENEQTKKALEAFKDSRTITLELNNHSIEECRAYFGVAHQETAIASEGWNDEGRRLTTDCIPLPNGFLKVSVSEGVSADTWNQISKKLMSVTIYVTYDTKIRLANTSPNLTGAQQRLGTIKKP